MSDLTPRRVSATVRYAVTAGFVAVASVLAIVSIRAGITAAAIVIGSLGLLWILLTLGNYGFSPRVRDRYLEVTTAIGRQSLDLAALSGARWERGRSGSVSVRLQDDRTAVIVSIPVPAQVYPHLKDALHAAATRGVLVPQRVTRLFNLPDIPGAPRTGASFVPVIVGVLAGALVVGVVMGLLASN
ncbi:hypothetical protein PWY87_01800 [Kribbella solani]|uniref:hypothetical protein n=1 Tax=Kribbella solani TaxID=236067 RepID=UPI0029B1B4AE|nr:hypothetical protein [Kribbella solani]MDX3000385.1 hypothetical protein [Kribbella solani]